jgi:cell division septation protein DedD
MFKNPATPSDGRGLSARQLALVFLTGVAVCGVFFSLGFLVGYNERSTRMAPVTERVSSPPAIPPTINTPLETTQLGPGGQAPSTNSIPPPVSQAQTTPISQSSERESETSAPPPAPPSRPEPGEKKSASGAGGQAGNGFIIQVVASRTKQDAETLVKILRGRSFPAILVTPEAAHAGDKLYRVQVGPFASKSEAERAQKKLIQEGFKPFLRH